MVKKYGESPKHTLYWALLLISFDMVPAHWCYTMYANIYIRNKCNKADTVNWNNQKIHSTWSNKHAYSFLNKHPEQKRTHWHCWYRIKRSMDYEANLPCVEQPLGLLKPKIIRDHLYICINTQNISNMCHVHVIEPVPSP